MLSEQLPIYRYKLTEVTVTTIEIEFALRHMTDTSSRLMEVVNRCLNIVFSFTYSHEPRNGFLPGIQPHSVDTSGNMIIPVNYVTSADE